MEAASAPALRERCAIHPHVDAIGTCERCGSYYCVACCKVIEGRTACRGCLQIPGVDYLRALRERCWGRRDGWVWYHGFFGSVAGLGTLALSLQKHAYVDLPVLIIGLPISVAYFLLKPAARRWLFAPTALSLVDAVRNRAQYT